MIPKSIIRGRYRRAWRLKSGIHSYVIEVMRNNHGAYCDWWLTVGDLTIDITRDEARKHFAGEYDYDKVRAERDEARRLAEEWHECAYRWACKDNARNQFDPPKKLKLPWEEG